MGEGELSCQHRARREELTSPCHTDWTKCRKRNTDPRARAWLPARGERRAPLLPPRSRKAVCDTRPSYPIRAIASSLPILTREVTRANLISIYLSICTTNHLLQRPSLQVAVSARRAPTAFDFPLQLHVMLRAKRTPGPSGRIGRMARANCRKPAGDSTAVVARGLDTLSSLASGSFVALARPRSSPTLVGQTSR